MSATKTATYIEAIGRRKTAVARVRLLPGEKGIFMINNRPFKEYFAINELQVVATRPFKATELDGHFSLTAQITGGGIHSQAEALALGIARALLKKDEQLKPTLRTNKLLTRDAREKERRKFGLKKARKSPQWSKR